MKHILITLLLGVSSFCFSQDTLQIPAVELEEFFLALDTLETQDSIKTVLITELEKQIAFHKELNDHNDLLLRYRDEEIELLKLQEIDNILKCSPEAIKKSKELLKSLSGQKPEEFFELTTNILADSWESKEGKQGIQAFFEKRPAPWVKKGENHG